MRLFDFRRAPNPRRVRLFLAEKGLDIPLVPVNLYRREQLTPEFLAINPAGTLPVLQTDEGLYLSECIAICHYIERRYPSPPLLGEGAAGEACVLMWNSICEHDGLRAVAETLRNLSPGFADHALPGPVSYRQLPDLVERGQRRMDQFFRRIEQRLAASAFLAGERFSFADLSLFATVEFARWVDYEATADRPATAAWYEAVAARPAIAASPR